MKSHSYQLFIEWTGNNGSGTKDYTGYDRSHTIRAANKPDIDGSADPAFRGDATRYNPEELLLASLSSCHMLWYLHLCSDAGVIVTGYTDDPVGTMTQSDDGGGEFTEVILRPKVTVQDSSMIARATELHQKARAFCFIARSVNFPVRHQPVCTTA